MLQTTPPEEDRTKHGLSPDREAAFEARASGGAESHILLIHKIQILYTPVPSLEVWGE